MSGPERGRFEALRGVECRFADDLPRSHADDTAMRRWLMDCLAAHVARRPQNTTNREETP